MNHKVLVALIEVQIEEIRVRRGQPLVLPVTPSQIADEVGQHIAALPPGIKEAVELALDTLDLPFRLFTGKSLADRVEFLRKGRWGGLGWQALSYALSLCWVVLFSRPEVAQAIGSSVLPSPPATPTDAVTGVDVRASLDTIYDVCVIGSGAGGSLVAFRLGAGGKSVLLMDSGKWIPPQQLGTRHDLALRTLYKRAGLQPALPTIGAVITGRAAGMNVLQANVFGGGPYVNNAIQLPIDRGQFDALWRPRGFPIPWDTLKDAMVRIADELKFGIPELDPARIGDPHSAVRPGERSNRVLAAAKALWQAAAANPVAFWNCVGCGGCNLGCRYNRKTGGVHGPRPAGAPKSYLMRAIEDTSGRVKLRSELQAIRFELDGKGHVEGIVARDLAAGELVSVRAKSYVLAAGPVASSRILQDTHLARRPQGSPKIGRRLAANVTTPVSAVMPTGITANPPVPGTQMCFYVEPEKGLLLEGWFDYPAGVSAGTSGLPRDVAASLARFGNLNTFGVVVPVDDLAEVLPPPFEIVADLKPRDFKRIVQAIAHAACALYKAGAESVTPGHRLNTNVVGPIVIDKADALAGNVAAITARLLDQLRGPENLSLQTPHPQGGNQMAATSSNGVVGPGFKVFGTSNLFVADSSLFPAGCGRNPQLTTLALADLASSSIAGCIDRGELERVEL